MSDVKLGVAVVDVQLNDAQALAKAQQSGQKIAAMLNGTIATALGRNDPFAALDKHASKERLLKIKLDARQAEQELKTLHQSAEKERLLRIRLDDRNAQAQLKALQQSADKEKLLRIKLDARQAEQELKRLEREQNKLERTEAYKLRVDTSQAQKAIRDSVAGLEQYQKMMGDIAARKVGANISMASSIGKDTRELERQLATVKEIERHRAALAKASKLNIDDSSLQKIKRELNELHNANTKAIKIKYDNSGMNGLKESLNNMLDGIARGAAASIGHRIVGSITGAVRGITNLGQDIIGDSLSTFGNYSENMSNFKMKASASAEEVQALEKAIMSMKSTMNPTELAKYSAELAQFGLNGKQTAEAIKPMSDLSVSTGVKDAAKLAQLLNTVQTTMGLTMSEAADLISTMDLNSSATATDSLQLFSKVGAAAKMAKQPVEDVSLMFMLLRDSGMQAQLAATGLNTAMTRLQAPNKAGAAALDSIGVAAFDASGNARRLIDVIRDLKKATSGMNDEMKIDIFKQIGGDRGDKIIKSLMQQLDGDKFNSFSDVLKPENREGFAANAASTKMKDFSGSVALMKAEIQKLQISFGNAIAPIIASMANGITQITENLRNAGIFDQLSKGAQELSIYLKENPIIIEQITAAIASLATDGFTWINEQVKQFTEYLRENPQAIQETLDSTKELIEDLAQLAIFTLEFSKGFAETAIFITSLLSPLGEVFNAITGSKDGSASLAENLGKAAGYLVVLGGIVSVANTMSAIAGYAATIAGLFGGWPAIWTAIQGVVTAVASVLSGTVVLAVAAIGITLYNIVTYMSQWDNVCLGVNQYIIDIDNWVKSIIGDSKILNAVWDAVKATIAYIVNPIGTIYQWIDQSVQKTGIFKSQWEGLTAIVTNVGNAINSVCGGALDAIIQKAQQFAGMLGSMLGMGGGSSGGGGSSTIAGVDLPPEIAAFIEMFRVGEGTEGDKGFTTMFTGAQFSDFKDHPRQLQSGGGFTSDAAGVGQFLSTTWDPVAQQIGAKDFSPANQIKGIVQLIKNRGAYEDLMQGNLDAALDKLSHEWASLPTSTTAAAGRYGQPAKTGAEAKSIYQQKLAAMKGQSTGGGIGSGFNLANAMTGSVSSQMLGGSNNGGLDGSGQNGADMPTGPNGEIYSYHNGVVSDLGTAGNNGNYVVIDYLDEFGNKLEATYSHIGAIVKKGQQVVGGQVLGMFDGSGRTFGAHNSIDINTPGTNGALQRDQESAIARRGAEILAAGKVQGQIQTTLSQASRLASTVSNAPLAGYTLNGATKIDNSAADAKRAAEEKKRKQIEADKSAAEAVAQARLRIDTALDQKLQQEDTAREAAHQAQLNKFRESRIGLTDSTAIEGSNQAEAIYKLEYDAASDRLKIEREIADLKTARSLKAADLKSKNPNLVADAKNAPDYTAAIKVKQSQLDAITKANSENLRLVNAEQDSQNELANRELDRAQSAQEQLNASNALLRSLKAQRSEIEGVGEEADRQRELLDLDIESAEVLARFNEQRVKLEQEISDKIAQRDKTGVGSEAYAQINKEVTTLNLKLTDLQESAKAELKIISDKELARSKEYLANLQKIQEETAKLAATERQNVGLSNADRLAGDAKERFDRYGEYDALGQNMQRQAIKDKFSIERDRARDQIKAQTAELNKQGTVRTPAQEAQLIANSDLEKARQAKSELAQVKTLGQEVGQMFLGTFQNTLDTLFSGTVSLGEALGNMLQVFSKQLFSLASSAILKNLFGGLLGGGALPTLSGGQNIPNYAGGKDSGILASIMSAATREQSQSGGLKPRLAMINEREIVLPASMADSLREVMGGSRLANLASGQNIPSLGRNAVVSGGGGMNFHGDINITSVGNSKADAQEIMKQMHQIAKSQTYDVLGRETRSGGILAR